MSSPSPTKTILVIEDNPDTLDNLALMLEMEGFKTLIADNGTDGLALARVEAPDLILCDMMMPGLDGCEVLSALRSEASTAAIPFIFLTARGERGDLRHGMNLGADDYITKPAGGDDVLAAVRARLIRQEQQEQATLERVEVATDFSTPEPLRIRLGLTAREAEVLLWIAQGKSNSDIAGILGNMEATVKIHANRIFEKLGVENRHSATLCALEILSVKRL